MTTNLRKYKRSNIRANNHPPEIMLLWDKRILAHLLINNVDETIWHLADILYPKKILG